VKLTKHTHACVRLEKDGNVLLIDPGVWTESEAFEGIDAILVTHEHFDHLDVDKVRALAVPIWANAGVAAALGDTGEQTELGERITVVEAGQSFEAVGFSISAYGNDHAIILPELGVPCQNTGYLVEGAVYHPGDSWTRPDRAVHTNLVPLGGPWFTTPDAVEYTRAVAAEQTIGIHDAMLSAIGQAIVKNWIGDRGGKPYHPLAPGDTVDIP
jgi:L-ascorbate metabolism protein UlaG (beta-lactamase superfamily)